MVAERDEIVSGSRANMPVSACLCRVFHVNSLSVAFCSGQDEDGLVLSVDGDAG